MRTVVLAAAAAMAVGVDASAQQHLYLDKRELISFATVNCGTPAYKDRYPCEFGGAELAVRALLVRVQNRLSVDPACHGILLDREDSFDYKRDWLLIVQIAFVDENAAPGWALNAPNLGPDWQGRDQPEIMAHLVCGIVNGHGAEMAPVPPAR